MDEKKGCGCNSAPRLIFACSGAADVGEVADHAARKLRDDGEGMMFCLAGVGGRVSGIMKTTEAAERVLAIDGCPLDCVRNCLEQAGFSEFEHLRLADLGLIKGSTEVSEQNVNRVAEEGAARLAR